MENRSTFVSIAILIVVVAAGLYLSYGSSTPSGQEQAGTPPPAVNPTPSANVVNKSKTYREIIPLKMVTESTDSGQAERVFDGISYSIEVFAGGLDSSKGQYQAWLYMDDSEDPISLGNMSKVESGKFKGALSVKYTSPKDLKNHNLVVVTLEKDKLLEGRFIK